ncbi:MAG: endonuclease/exonuclease/phosphatase family protein [Rhodobacteraceae bacterium]|nr:endonuclease/exonuclease/phosphatase family protein [Paracoccaceae bacterium]
MTLPAPPESGLRLISYNIRKCLGLDMRRRPERILRVLDGSEADIAVLQEADRRLPPRPSALPVELLDQAGWEALDLGGADSLGWHGNAILLRQGRATWRDKGHLPLPGLEPRGAVWAQVSGPQGDFVVIGLHLGLVATSRREQMQALMRHLDDLPDLPLVWAGDFNEWARGTVLDHNAPDMRFLPPRPSFPAAHPLGALDRIALRGGIEALDHGVITAQPARMASDHLPIWADLHLT